MRIWAETGRLLGIPGYADGATLGGISGGGSLGGLTPQEISEALVRGVAGSTFLFEIDGRPIEAKMKAIQARTARGLTR